MNEPLAAGTSPALLSKESLAGTFFSAIVAPVSQADARCDWLRRVLVLFALLLLAVTWKLWTPHVSYPQVPLLDAFRATPAWLQWGVLGGQAISLLMAIAAPKNDRRMWRFALASFAGLTLFAALVDQHRFQPWAYQMAVIGVVLALCPATRAIVLLRVLTVSIYFFSAVSKIDYVFLHTVGQQLSGALLEFVHIDADAFSPITRLRLALLLPIGELLVACGLCWHRTRFAALIAAIAMHVMLFFAVGPWGLSHKPGVLVWNLFFIAQNLLLFTNRFPAWAVSKEESSDEKPSQPASTTSNGLGVRFAHGLVIAVVLLPLLEPWGRFDHWLAWGLYAPKSSRAQTFIHRSARDRLPKALQSHLQEEQPDSPWLRLRIDNWSLNALDVPIYPQDRFQLGVAEAVGRRYGLNRLLRVVLMTPADRFTGKRESTTLEGVQAIVAARKRYWFNTHPGVLYVQNKSTSD